MAAPSPLTRRNLLTTGAAACTALATAALPAAAAGRPRTASAPGFTVLTISGPGIRTNRGASDATLDRMLNLHGYTFGAAWQCDAAALSALAHHRLHTHIEYDDAAHTLQGPLLETVLQAAGMDTAAALRQGHWLTFQAIDGYRVFMPVAQALQWGITLATHMDGQPLGMGGLGPVWAMYNPQTIASMAGLPQKQHFAQAAWGLYYLRVSAEQPQA